MERIPVHSSALRSVGYDVDSRILEIEVANGDVYRYFDVPDDIHLGLMTADSQGRFYADFIRNAGYDYQRVE